jgi:F-type H+-transporting ATPase subunit epsilon
MLEVQPSIVTVLSDTALRAEDLDEAAILKAKEDAEKVFHDRDAKIDYAAAQAALAETVAQLQTIQRLRKIPVTSYKQEEGYNLLLCVYYPDSL